MHLHKNLDWKIWNSFQIKNKASDVCWAVCARLFLLLERSGVLLPFAQSQSMDVMIGMSILIFLW